LCVEFYTDDQTDGEIESSAQSSDMVDVLTMLRQNITKLVTLNRDELQVNTHLYAVQLITENSKK